MKRIVYYGLIIGAMSSCVTAKKYDDLNARKARLEAEKVECDKNLAAATEDLDAVKKEQEELEKKYASLSEEHEQVEKVLKRTKQEYGHLEELHDRLTSKYSELLKLSSQQSSQMNKDLAKREAEMLRMEGELRNKREEANTLADELAKREARVKELEDILEEQQKAVNELKAKVSHALLGFDNKDLTVEMRNGKVYVSLTEQLLFKSGSKTVDKKGVEALKKLAGALKGNDDLGVLVEGHTDNVPMSSSANGIKDNWDLSVLRATSIVRILTEEGVDPKNVSASGRGEYIPVDTADTKEARRKNRRIEIILTPKLDELFQMLQQQ